MSTKPASSALYYTVVNPGLHTPHKNGSSWCSTWGALIGSLKLHSRTRCKTMTFSQELVFHPCSQSYIKVIYAGWVTLTGWKMGTSLRIYSMVSSPMGLGAEATPTMLQGHFASVTSRHATLKLSHGKPLQATKPCGSSKCHKDWKEGRLPSEKKMMKDGPGEQPFNSKTMQTHIRHLSSHARAVAEMANPGLASTATQDDVHQQPLMGLLQVDQQTDALMQDSETNIQITIVRKWNNLQRPCTVIPQKHITLFARFFCCCIQQISELGQHQKSVSLAFTLNSCIKDSESCWSQLQEKGLWLEKKITLEKNIYLKIQYVVLKQLGPWVVNQSANNFFQSTFGVECDNLTSLLKKGHSEILKS